LEDLLNRLVRINTETANVVHRQKGTVSAARGVYCCLQSVTVTAAAAAAATIK